MRLPELLAPAGSRDALVAAIAAGADAVYLSGRRYGARKFASNFDEDGLRSAIAYAHIRGVKVYVTANTLVRDDEMEEVARYLIKLYEMGADAVLVQDLGAAALARSVAPGLRLHASTQMTVHNTPGAAWAEKRGMERVVLSREVSLEEARRMAKKLDAGVEVFIHGALCYCYSGQCFLSAVIGGRSGNRGMCAQPCRKPYVLLRGGADEYGRPEGLAAAPVKDRYLISTRDLCVYDQLDKIVRSGVASLKIEGRMKSPQYVAIVTDVYRRALDAIASSKGGWKPSAQDRRDLALAFNRDFTGGYLLRSDDIMGREMSDKRGILIGTVSAYDPRSEEAAVRLAGDIAPVQGDGLVIISPDAETGVVVHRQPYMKDGLLRLRTPGRVKPGAKVYMTSSQDLTKRAESIVSRERGRISLRLKISWDGGVPVVKGEAVGPRGPVRFGLRGAPMEPAESRPISSEQIEAQIRKTGGTPFFIERIDIKYPGGLFAPISAVNALRRDTLAAAEGTILDGMRPIPADVEASREKLSNLDLKPKGRPSARSPSLAAYASDIEGIRGAAKAGCERIYFEPHLGRIELSSRAKALGSALRDAREACGVSALVWKWPRITRDDFLNLVAPVLAGADIDGVMVEGVGAAEAAKAARPDLPVYGASGLNVWNRLTVEELKDFCILTISPELSADQIEPLTTSAPTGRPGLEIIAHGSLEVVVTEDCLPCLSKEKAQFFGLQDFRRVFPLFADDDGRTHILNSSETCLVDHMERIFALGLDGIAIDARGRTRKYSEEMAGIYRRAIDLTAAGGENLAQDLTALKDEARRMSIGGITTGPFLRGLKDEVPDLEICK